MSEPVLLVLGLVASIALAVIAKRVQCPIRFCWYSPVLGSLSFPVFPPSISRRTGFSWPVLPPLLFSAGWSTDWTLFRANLRPILQLAIGLVILTTIAVTGLALRVLPELGFAAAFALGAIVSPTDAVAAGATFTRFTIPRRIVAVVEGEGLINDATALVVYSFAVAAAGAATFSIAAAGESFVIVSAGQYCESRTSSCRGSSRRFHANSRNTIFPICLSKICC